MINLIFMLIFFSSLFQTNYCKLSDKIFNDYNKILLKENKDLLLTAKGGAMMHDIEEIDARYLSFEPMTLVQARKLYIDIIEGYLQAYNNNEKVRPYLHNYPFTVDNLHIMIGFADELKRHRGDGYVALILRARGKIFYETYDHEKKDFVDLHSETYEEARRLTGYE